MPIEINMVQVHPQAIAEFEAAFAQAAPILRSVAGCTSVTLLHCLEVPGLYHVQVSWQSLADHVEAYPKSEQASIVRALLAPFIETGTMRHFEAIAL